MFQHCLNAVSGNNFCWDLSTKKKPIVAQLLDTASPPTAPECSTNCVWERLVDLSKDSLAAADPNTQLQTRTTQYDCHSENVFGSCIVFAHQSLLRFCQTKPHPCTILLFSHAVPHCNCHGCQNVRSLTKRTEGMV